MKSPTRKEFETTYPVCRSAVGLCKWQQIFERVPGECTLATFSKILAAYGEGLGLPDFLPDLAGLEWNLYQAEAGMDNIPFRVDKDLINPTLQLLSVSWKHLPSLLRTEENISARTPEPGKDFILIWRDSRTGKVRAEAAADRDLLALKIVMEGIDVREVASKGNVSVTAVEGAVADAVRKGLILSPPSGLRRDSDSFPAAQNTDEVFLSSPVFTLQWHITQACDLHCKHCYDRSDRSALKLDQAIGVLEDLWNFCHHRRVRGQVSFTGGNPLLYPHFLELYRAASEKGFILAILGNPVPKDNIEELISIQAPAFFQVSLEGLEEKNDAVRGPGHFKRVVRFLDVLRDLKIYSMVMLTLTRYNMDQVLPLAHFLKERADCFTFNRLSQVGEGSNLQLPEPDLYRRFLRAYGEAAADNPIMALKDNLINILHHLEGKPLFGGCCGYGCGAAFNFMAVLPDGEAHACRKFPSLIGHVFQQTIAEIYDSELACRYRAGSSACRSCSIRPVCGGCPAVIHGQGGNVFNDRDPYCFMESENKS